MTVWTVEYPRVCGGTGGTMRHCPPWVYPRVCGGTTSWTFCHHPEIGLSPRVRGNPAIIRHPVVALGSIPACAGEPYVWDEKASERGVYPRVCGGTLE